MSCVHEITINNFKSGETVYYSVVIIKGIIKSSPEIKCQKPQIEIKINFSEFLYKVTDSKFKVLVELNHGKNTIMMNYCSSSVTLNLNYIQSERDFAVLPLYIICNQHDGTFQAPKTEPNDSVSACKRINLGVKLLQSVIAEKLYEENFGRKTFKLLDCKIFHSQLNFRDAWEMTQEELWTYLGREIVNSDLGHEKTKFLGFLSCTRYCGEKYRDNFSHDEIVKITQAYVALGGGGLALFGSACLYTWPEDISHVIEKFECEIPVDRAKFMDDSCYRGTLGACFSTTLGSVLHELCHTFDLGHTEKGIMGRGFDDIHKVFVCNKSKNRKQHLNSIEFGERIGCGDTKTTKLLMKEDEEDGTFWTRSCLVLLAYHKWLNDYPNQKNNLKFDPVTKILNSTKGLRVIELRNEANGLVLLNWVFDGRILKYFFQIPEEQLKTLTENSVIMFVEDNIGNILKCEIKIFK